MERIRLETDRDERIRRQVRENSLELRELENKLRDAYTGRVAQGGCRSGNRVQEYLFFKNQELVDTDSIPISSAETDGGILEAQFWARRVPPRP